MLARGEAGRRALSSLRAGAALAASAALAAGAALGCARAESRPSAAGGDPSAPASAAPHRPRGVEAPPAPPSGASPASPPPSAAPPARATARCRVMSATGEATAGGAPLAAGATLGARRRVELGQAATLHLVHSASARQWTLAGPARFFACEGGAEEIVLALGSLRAEPGSGVRPGAEVWVGTPFGSLRYSDARAQIDVTPDALRVQVSAGSVWFSPLGGPSSPERELASGAAVFPARPYRLSSAAAKERCERAAAAAEARASALLAPRQEEPLGARAREHVRARQAAHGTCSSALAALLAGDGSSAAPVAPDDQTRADYSALARFERLWRGVPEPAAPGP